MAPPPPPWSAALLAGLPRPARPAGGRPPARLPAIPAAVCLMLGAALLLRPARRGAWLAELLAAVPVFLGLVAIPWELVLLVWPSPRATGPRSLLTALQI